MNYGTEPQRTQCQDCGKWFKNTRENTMGSCPTCFKAAWRAMRAVFEWPTEENK